MVFVTFLLRSTDFNSRTHWLHHMRLYPLYTYSMLPIIQIMTLMCLSMVTIIHVHMYGMHCIVQAMLGTEFLKVIFGNSVVMIKSIR